MSARVLEGEEMVRKRIAPRAEDGEEGTNGSLLHVVFSPPLEILFEFCVYAD